MVREDEVAEICTGVGIEQFQGLRSLDGDYMHIVVIFEAQIPVFGVFLQKLVRRAGAARHQEVILSHIVDDSIVTEVAVVFQDGTIGRLADRGFGHIASDEIVDGGQCIRSADMDLRQCRGIPHANGLANRVVLEVRAGRITKRQGHVVPFSHLRAERTHRGVERRNPFGHVRILPIMWMEAVPNAGNTIRVKCDTC